jgi:hypothetical protein
MYLCNMKYMKRVIFLFNIFLLGVACRPPEPAQPRWYKGDLHVRALSPGEAYARGYDFVVVDTAYRTAEAPAACVAMPGSECVDERGVWTTAVNTAARIWTAAALREEVLRGNTSPNVLAYIPQDAGELVSHHLRNIRRAGGLAVLSRSTLSRLSPETAAAIDGLQFVEIFDGDTLAEAPWDSLLTRRKTVFAVAADTSRAGRAWVVAQADSLTPTGVAQALAQGRFYASSGVALRAVVQEHTRFSVEVDTAATRKRLPASLQRACATDTACYEITFITAGGKTAKRVAGLRGRYASQPGDGYVRVRVTCSHPADSLAFHAWTQPWMLTF